MWLNYKYIKYKRMNIWIIVLSTIGGIVVGWAVGWIMRSKKAHVELNNAAIKYIEYTAKWKKRVLAWRSDEYDQVLPNMDDIESDYRNKGYQEWVEEHQTDDQLLDEIYKSSDQEMDEVTVSHYLQLKEGGLS